MEDKEIAIRLTKMINRNMNEHADNFSNEQREAIEYLKESVLIYKNTIPRISNAIETALNLIKQQERKILDYDEIIARLEEENTRKDKIINEQLKFYRIY